MEIIKITQEDTDFYKYMGKVFGSRKIESKINDRIYDDKNKEWHILIEEEEILAFLSIANNKIKNIYGEESKYIIELLQEVSKTQNIEASTVTRVYQECYEKCGFRVLDKQYKNFVVIEKKEGLINESN